jgi:hypothetical protein
MGAGDCAGWYQSGLTDLGKLASPMLEVKRKITWRERLNEKRSQHPEIARYAKVLAFQNPTQ